MQNPHAYVGQEIIIAHGKEPVHGQDSYLEMVYEQKEEKKPKIMEDGGWTFTALSKLQMSKKGQLLAKKIPASPGEDGMTVTGEVVKAKEGRDLPIKVGKNVVVDQKNQAVYSLLAGQVSMLDGKLNVFPVFEVNGDLDFSVGNIDFVGNVVIRGNVPTGFSVKAKGDIRITGGVEGVELEADGNIEINSGITAQHKGLIKAKGDIKTSFILNAKVETEGNVYVSQSIMHSEISAGGSVICQGPKGLIVGGKIQAGKSVVCRVIGNDLNTPTSVEIGVNPKVSNRLKEIEQSLVEYKTMLTKNEQALSILNHVLKERGELPPDRRELYAKLTTNKLNMERHIKNLEDEHQQLLMKQEEEEQAFVEVSSFIYPGTKLTFNKYTKYFKDKQQRVKCILEHGEIVCFPIY